MIAWVSTSASEWPASPRSCVDLDAAEHQPAAGREGVAVVADAGLRRVTTPRSASSSSASRRSIGRGDLQVLRVRARPRARCRPRARPARRRRWRPPAARRTPPPAPARARRGGTPAASAPPTGCLRSSVRATVRPSSPTSLIVSDTGVAAITASAPSALELVQRALEQLGRWPAGGPRRGRSPDRRRPQACSASRTDCERVAPPATATTPVGPTSSRPGGQRDDDPLHRRHAPAARRRSIRASAGLQA